MLENKPVAMILLAAFCIGATTRPEHNSTIWARAIAAFKATDRKEMPSPGGVDFVGSSTVRIWNLKAAFPNQNVINRGFGGSWSADCDYFADQLVFPYKPRTVIFYAGDNDIGGGAPASEVVQSFKDFVKKVHATLPETKIVFISIKPSPSRWKYWDVMQEANSAILKFSRHTPGVSFVDATNDMLGADGKPRMELFRKDGLHMNQKGYAIWNEKIRRFVDSDGKSASGTH